MAILKSFNPATGEMIWQGQEATLVEVELAVARARKAFATWQLTTIEHRIDLLKNYVNLLQSKREQIAKLIALENGKVWREANAEAGALIGKVTISIEAYHKRTGIEHGEIDGGVRRILAHRPHGVMTVFSPYNFPMHLANGHIVPCLLAGNVVLLKPSEETPACGEMLVGLLHEAGFAPDVVQVIQGGRDVGAALSSHHDIDGVLFTGSYATGQKIHQALAGKPEIMLALEMGGNNPLILSDVEDAEAAASIIIDSAYASTGQRCTCARRLLLVESAKTNATLDALIARLPNITVGGAFDQPEPYMGCIINNVQAENVLKGQELLRAKGGKILHKVVRINGELPFLNAGLIETTNADRSDDLEIFGPLLQVIKVKTIDEALQIANQTRYGLSAGLIADNAEIWDYVYPRLRAGLVNFNRPLTGAASSAPFGGVGVSGNHRPTAYYAADYSAYPVASLTHEYVQNLNLVGVR